MGQRGRKILEEAIASHELRTSIMSILCVTELLNTAYIEQNKQEIPIIYLALRENIFCYYLTSIQIE